ncbi:MAG TPA: hypothetical protein VGB68_03940, partial [Pyrinomonadaceae bacterium]
MSNEAKNEGDGNFFIQGISGSEITINPKHSHSDKKPAPLPKHITIQSLTPPNYFTGREKVLSDIAETLNARGKAALCGISGLGKSSVVLK